jgi:phosphatidylserine decarboxylase
MSIPIKIWSNEIQKIFKNIPVNKIQTELFLRDPIRSMKIEPSIFFSPADGIIMYQKVVHGKNEVVDIKGINYTLSDLLEKDFNHKCLVIGIFMTYYDVHINRMPTAGLLKFRELTPIKSANLPMEIVENDILASNIGKAYNDMGKYLKYNARMVNEIYSSDHDYTYYITQIADDEVNVITHFTTRQNQWFHQNQRFSFVRWGSQVELVLPLDNRYKFKLLIPIYHHILGGIDGLVKIEKRIN